jgi:hypothetical protein
VSNQSTRLEFHANAGFDLEARKHQRADSYMDAARRWEDVPKCARCARLDLVCRVPPGLKKKMACSGCAKVKEKCEWPEAGATGSSKGKAGMTLPRGGEKKKQVRSLKARVEDEVDKDDEIKVEVTGMRGRDVSEARGSWSLVEVVDRRLGELIDMVTSRLDVTNNQLWEMASMQRLQTR